MEVEFPLIVLEKDDKSMYLIETRANMGHLEAIDIENDEYVFWDSSGAGVCVSVAHGAIDQITFCNHSKSVSGALKVYSQLLGLQVSLEGSPLDVWRRIQSQIPRKQTLWERLFGKSGA